MFDWVQQNRDVFYVISIASVFFFVASLVAVSVVIVRLPPDHFEKEQKKPKNLALRIGRNVLGWLLIVAGLAMLVLPGQGMLVLLIGVMLADFPGKPRLQRWMVSRKGVLKTMNWLRKKFGREPLRVKGKGGGRGEGEGEKTDVQVRPTSATGAKTDSVSV